MKSGTGDLPFGRSEFLHDRKVARSAGSSGKLPDLAAAVAQIRGRSTYIGRAAAPGWREPRSGRPARGQARVRGSSGPGPGARSSPMPGRGQDLIPIRAASLAAAVRDETPILDNTAETWWCT